MKVLPPRSCQKICCGLFAIALVWSTTATAQQNRSNPLRQPSGRSTARQQRESASRTEAETGADAVLQTVTVSTAEYNARERTNETPSLVQQAAYQTSSDDTRRFDNDVHQASHSESVLQQEPQYAFVVQKVGGIDQKGVFQKGVFQKGVFQKGGIVQKGVCSSCNGGGCFQCCLPCIPFSLDNLELFGGVQGFSGPANRGGTASFGFHEGFNIGMPMPCFNGCFGVQFGFRATQDNFSGAGFPTDVIGNTLFTDGTRNQIFLTSGIFRRVDWGLQGGISIDYLADNWYVDTSLTQLRGEASWVFPCAHELGFMFSSATDEDQQMSVFMGGGPLTEIWEATNQYAFFYRHRPAYLEGAEARIYAGWSGDSDGIIGADMRLPLHDSLALELGVSYLIPEQATTGAPLGGHEEESWNMAVSLVWYPGCRSAYGGDYFRPLLNVADNGSFRVSRR